MSDCLFCKFNDGTVPVSKIYEDEQAFAVNDINPQAPVHVLIIPKKHLSMIETTTEADEALLGHLIGMARTVAQRLQLTHGYRLVINDGSDGQQSVSHIHVHLMGGRPFTWPAG